MKLYEVPKKTYVKVKDKDLYVFFDHIDGAYSYCIDSEDNLIHLLASTEVTIIDPPPTW